MADVKLELRNLAEIERRIQGLGKAVATRVIRNTTAGPGRHIAREIKKVTPVDSGALKKSISYRNLRVRNGRAEGVVRAKQPAGSYFHLVEDGTERIPGRYFARRAVNQNKDKARAEALKAAQKALIREYRKLGINP